MFFDKCKYILRRNKSEFIGFLFGLILFSFLVVRYLSIQKPSNPPERNKIVINVSPNELEDSLKVFEPLIIKIPMHEFGFYMYEIIDSNNLKIRIKLNDNNCIDIKSTLNSPINNIEIFKKFTKPELNRFLKLIIFFNKNHLYTCQFSNETKAFTFDYRMMKVNNGDWQYDLYRYIYYSTNNTIYEHGFRKMDKKGHLYLLAHYDSHIW